LAIIAWAWRAGFAVEAQRDFLKLNDVAVGRSQPGKRRRPLLMFLKG
jgi:hypothetical protein